MPAHSLQRSQYVNGLAELPAQVREPLFGATAELVRAKYRTKAVGPGSVPWHPYNFHAGNFYDAETGYSPQVRLSGQTAALPPSLPRPLPPL